MHICGRCAGRGRELGCLLHSAGRGRELGCLLRSAVPRLLARSPVSSPSSCEGACGLGGRCVLSSVRLRRAFLLSTAAARPFYAPCGWSCAGLKARLCKRRPCGGGYRRCQRLRTPRCRAVHRLARLPHLRSSLLSSRGVAPSMQHTHSGHSLKQPSGDPESRGAHRVDVALEHGERVRQRLHPCRLRRLGLAEE